MGSKGGGSTTTVQKADPWSGQQPYLKDIFSEAQNLYNSGAMAPDYYSGNTVAPQSQWTQNALQMQADRAMNGSASIDTALAGMDNITSGGALAGNTGMNTLNQIAGTDINAGNQGLTVLNQMTNAVNPYSSALLNDAVGGATAQIDSGFSGAGRYGSGAHENARADAVADLTNQFYSNAYDQQMAAAQAASGAYLGGLDTQASAANQAGSLYNTGIGQQVVAGNTAQQLANQAYTDAAALSEAGGVKDDYAQQLINADIDRYNYESQQPLTALSNYNQLIQGSYGGTSTTTGQQASGGSTLGNVLGGALSGGGLGYGLAAGTALGGPWGAAIGATAGGLLGLL